MDRRLFLGGAVATTVAFALGRHSMAASEETESTTADFPAINKTKSEWKALLTEQEYAVLFEEATERPWTSPLNKEKRDGTYICAACYLPLFHSDTKYDSGTGWPSFYQAIPGHTGTSRDWKLLIPRTEYHCARCGGHQGHVFNDGPKPTGQRWCNNGVALKFIPSSGELPELRA
ncbi:peptide-methionine (R)-S-oxide reductase MsrB [Hahella ganghwensis]|uniref:peptide-methionine (R)-S-oxide reductase MsrB n=1 Tax=Hahella ganghwensis TaxID=286420 RepID=UPI0003A2473D|nr:peptide-methionine (R)-S-oxide reductase MsrB [Hahella ganghwensis]